MLNYYFVRRRVAARLVLLPVASISVALAAPDAGQPHRSAEIEPEYLFARLAPSVLMVLVDTSVGARQGSGVVVAPDLVATNAHVVEGATSVRVRSGERDWPAVLIRSDSRDIAILRVAGLNRPVPRRRRAATLSVGERVYSLGSPDGLELTFADGLVSRLGNGFIQTSAPISSGSSGGGLFDARGRLVGITTSALVGSRSVVRQNLNFALPVDLLEEVLQGSMDASSKQTAVPSRPRWDAVNRPQALRCETSQRATVGYFPSGLEVLERRALVAQFYVHAFRSDAPTLSNSTDIGVAGRNLKLYDLRTSDGFVQFSSPTTETEAFFTIPAEGDQISVSIVRPVESSGPVKFEVMGGWCLPSTAAELAQQTAKEAAIAEAALRAQPGFESAKEPSERCNGGLVDGCLEQARKDEREGAEGSAALYFMKACDLDSLEGCQKAARLYRSVNPSRADAAAGRARFLETRASPGR
ncbi:MAG: S1C family serine protease [Myxococcaceae bacterium]|nr:S1C family serine protease [Myxococcaceae bacterium]